MTIKNDKWIAEQSYLNKMINPFVNHQVRDGVISYGLSGLGYDLRLGSKFYVLKQGNALFDPKNQSDFDWDVITTEYPFIVHPNDYILSYSIETFSIPEDVLVLVIGKSTYARSGLLVNVTPGEPGWTGQWTLELSNPTKRPIKIYPNEGIAQCLFFQSDEVAQMPYNKKNGKYMNQSGVTLAKIDK
jgi:dCTP deaminase